MLNRIFDSMGRCGVRISQRLNIILQRGQVLWLRFGSRSIVFVSCFVSSSALTNYAEYCHSFSNRITGLVYKSLPHTSTSLSPQWLQSSPLSYAPPEASLLGPVLASIALQLCSKWVGTRGHDAKHLPPHLLGV